MKRRDLLKQGGLLLSFTVAGQIILASPAQAKAGAWPLQTLSPELAQTAEILAEAIAPGARAGGIVHFLDQQLSQKNDTDCLLMIRYLGVPQPFTDFYSAAFKAVNLAAQGRYNKPLAKLSEEQLEELVSLIATDAIEHWQGPPSSFFYFVFRADAVDVTYGTQAAFAELNIPYMAHITPDKPW